MMLELLLTRQDELDQRVVANCEDLDFLVLDELHTYRGRQGADVAMLVRRLRDRLAPGKDILCVGTSATMTSEGGQGGREVVADIASKLFATTIHPTDVVIETLERRTDPMQSAETVKPRLAAAIRAGTPDDATDAVLAADPLAIWAETTLGIEQEPNNGPWIRATPRSLSDAAKLLAGDSGVDERDCEEALKTLLLVASRTEQQRTGRGSDKPFFGVRLHQFISGAGRAHSTIEPLASGRSCSTPRPSFPKAKEKNGSMRYISATTAVRNTCRSGTTPTAVRGASRPGPSRICRSTTTDEDDCRFGFFMPIPPEPIEFGGDDADYPETWTERAKNGDIRLISAYRKLKHERIRVLPTGEITSSGGVEGWFQPKKFRFCPACGELTLSKGADIYRLAALSAEGRSSATTVLVASILKWMHDPGLWSRRRTQPQGSRLHGQPPGRGAPGRTFQRRRLCLAAARRGLFGSSLQAGRTASTTEGSGKRSRTRLDSARRRKSTFEDWLASPNLEGPLLLDAERTLREVLAHRFWVDQQRGWRVTNPNLERLHLLRAEYRGLDELVANDAKFERAHPLLKSASPERRRRAYTVLFDHMRKGLAVDTVSLEQPQLEDVRRRAGSLLKAPWSLTEEKPQVGSVLILDRTTRPTPAEEEVFRIRGGATSALGRSLRASGIWGQRLAPKDYDRIVREMLAAGRVHRPEAQPFLQGDRRQLDALRERDPLPCR